jgi:uncharacterized protein
LRRPLEGGVFFCGVVTMREAIMDHAAVRADATSCQSCGACCAYSASWPRFSLESDADLARIPEALVDPSQSGMRCVAERCSALAGRIGEAVACTIYDIRPDVCRACEIGDDACQIARAAHCLPPIVIDDA